MPMLSVSCVSSYNASKHETRKAWWRLRGDTVSRPFAGPSSRQAGKALYGL